MARIVPLLTLLLVVTLASPVLGRSATDAYGDALDMMSGSRAVTKAAADPGTTAAEMKALMAHVERELNLAKAELRQLEAAYRTALRDLKGDAHECERETLTGIYAAERMRLKTRIREYRRIRGDRRGFFSKAWHSIGPVGRRIARSIGDGALDALSSGGLSGGVARRLLLSAGRDELKGAALRAVSRSVQGRAAVAAAAAGSRCDGDDADSDTPAEDVPAILPGTYIGEWPMDLSPDSLVAGKVAQANFAELRVADDGAIEGEALYHLTGVFDGCPGYIEKWGFSVDAGERIGSELPQSVGIAHDALILVPVVGLDNDVQYICGRSAEPFIDDSGSAQAEVDVTDDGGLVVVIEEEVLELQWVP